MLAAARHAEAIGCPFNRHWTLHYERAGIAEAEAVQFIGRLLKLVRDYAARKYGTFTGIWVRENGEGKGGHVHILMHLPSGASLSGRTGKWLRLAGGNGKVRVSRVRSIGGVLITAENGGEHYRVNAAAVLSYVLKGASRDVGEARELPRYGEGGLVIGKRCGWTQNVGSAARNRKRG